MSKEQHGKSGHLNIYTLDHDSIVTHYGLHDRVVAFLPHPGSDQLTIFLKRSNKF